MSNMILLYEVVWVIWSYTKWSENTWVMWLYDYMSYMSYMILLHEVVWAMKVI